MFRGAPSFRVRCVFCGLGYRRQELRAHFEVTHARELLELDARRIPAIARRVRDKLMPRTA